MVRPNATVSTSLPEKAQRGFSESEPEGFARGPGCTLHILGEIEDLQSAETYPVVKVRPCGPDGTLADPACPAIRWSVGSCPLIRGAMSTRCEDEDTTARGAVDRPLNSSSIGAFRPAIHLRLVRPGGRSAFGHIPGGGDEETRTPDPLLAKEMLCQLSYVPRRQPEWWATLDSNQ